jgi:hypothetical protein
VLDVQRDYVGDVARGKAYVHPRDLYLGSHYGVLHEIAANLRSESDTLKKRKRASACQPFKNRGRGTMLVLIVRMGIMSRGLVRRQ